MLHGSFKMLTRRPGRITTDDVPAARVAAVRKSLAKQDNPA